MPVPPGLKPGGQFKMTTDSGENIWVKVPTGFKPGQVMEVKVPKPALGAPPLQQSVPAAPPAGVQVQIPAGVGGFPRTALRVGAGIHGCELIFESDVPLPGGTRVSVTAHLAVED